MKNGEMVFEGEVEKWDYSSGVDRPTVIRIEFKSINTDICDMQPMGAPQTWRVVIERYGADGR